MVITQTVEIPADRRLTIDVPREVPTGPVILTFTPADNGCPLCAKYRAPETGEVRFSAETEAGMKEVDDMIAGKIPAKWYNSIEEMLSDPDD